MSGSINLDPMIATAAQQTGVPYPLANAVFSQESGKGAASPNIGQITAGTAANPGYGMPSISQSDIQDPYKNVLWSLSYLKARAQAAGKDVSDPSQWGQILPSYNGTGAGAGDPQYAQHVLSRIGMTAPNSSAGSLPPDPASPPPVQPGQLPAMPANFGTQTQPSSPAAVVDSSGHQGDPLIAFGTALAGGNGFHDGIAKAGAAYSDAQAQQLKNAQLNASFQNDADNRDADAPTKAAQTASLRADAWKALNPVVSPDAALQANTAANQQGVEVRGQDVNFADIMARQQYMAQLAKGQPQTLVVPNPDGSAGKTVIQTSTPGGVRFTDPATGQTASTLNDIGAAGAVPTSIYNPQVAREAALDVAGNKAGAALINQGTAADNQLDSLKTTLANAAKPGAMAAPGIINTFGRAFDSLTGTSTFGNLTQEQVAKMGEGQQNWAQIRSAIQGTGGRLTNQEVSRLTDIFPNVGTDPAARTEVAGILSHGLQRQSDLAKSFEAMPSAMRSAMVRNPVDFASWQSQQNDAWNKANPIGGTAPAAGSATTLTTAPAASGGAQQLPPLASFLH